MRIAVDGMGGDFAPGEIVRGTLLALSHLPKEVEVYLVGDKKLLDKEITSIGGGENISSRLNIIHTSQIIYMNESPIEAIREKPEASLVKCLELVANKEADVMISAGNTGAIVTGTLIKWGFLEGIKRPGIAVPLPNRNGDICYLIDAGANVYCNPIHLLQYGIMASVYCREVNKIPHPRVGLLNIGEEDSKGNQLVRETLNLFKKSPLNFIGNVEGQHIWEGNCDVVVCEGFVGNVILKSAEGLVEFVYHYLMKAFGDNQISSDSLIILKEIINRLKSKIDYAEYGGAPLLGVKGKVIICHGRSRHQAISRAIEVANNFARQKVNEEIVNTIKQTTLSWLDILKSWRIS